MKCWVLKMNFQNLFPWQHTKGKCDYIFILISLIWVNQPLKLTILRGIYSFPLSCSCQIPWAELSESVSGKKKSDQSIPCRGWNPNQKPTLQVSTIWHYISTILTTELLFALLFSLVPMNVNILTEHFEEELPFLRSCLVGGLASVGTPVALSDVADG